MLLILQIITLLKRVIKYVNSIIFTIKQENVNVIICEKYNFYLKKRLKNSFLFDRIDFVITTLLISKENG